MDRPVDKRGKLDKQVFSCKVTKDGKVFVSWHGKRVAVLCGDKAAEFIADIADAEGKDAQLIMARVTGNFKRGNEKPVRRRQPGITLCL